MGKKTKFRSVVNKYVLADNAAQLNALDKARLLHGSYAPRNPKEAAQFGVKVIFNDLGLLRGANGLPPIDIKPGMAVPERPTQTNESAKPAVPRPGHRPADIAGGESPQKSPQ